MTTADPSGAETQQHDQLTPVLTDEDTVNELESSGDMEQDVFQWSGADNEIG